MIVWLLTLFVTNAYGAAIPSQPVIPTTSACLQGCFESGSVVNAAFDLLNFRSIAVDIDDFCSINAALLKCGQACPAERLPELEARTHASSYICGDKLEEFRMVTSCLAGAEDVTSNCAMECGVPTVVPLRLDSSAAASVNPTVFLDGIAGICRKQICLVRCTQDLFNKECAGAGDLFMDLAKHQVRRGIDNLIKDSTNENLTTIRLMTENYVKNLPSDCGFLKDINEFEKVFVNKEHKDPESSTTLRVGIVTMTVNESSGLPESSEAEEGLTAAPAEGEGFVMDSVDQTTVINMSASSPSVNEDKKEVEEERTEPSKAIETAPSEVSEAEPSEATETETAEATETETAEATETEPSEVTEAQPSEISDVEPAKIMVEEVTVDVRENQTDADMSENVVTEMSPTPVEPVIVVDNTSNDIGENTVQAGLTEVKSSTASVIVSSMLFIAVSALLLV